MILDELQKFIADRVDMAVIWEHANSPRPPRPFISLYITSMQAIGHDEDKGFVITHHDVEAQDALLAVSDGTNRWFRLKDNEGRPLSLVEDIHDVKADGASLNWAYEGNRFITIDTPQPEGTEITWSGVGESESGEHVVLGQRAANVSVAIHGNTNDHDPCGPISTAIELQGVLMNPPIDKLAIMNAQNILSVPKTTGSKIEMQAVLGVEVGFGIETKSDLEWIERVTGLGAIINERGDTMYTKNFEAEV